MISAPVLDGSPCGKRGSRNVSRAQSKLINIIGLSLFCLSFQKLARICSFEVYNSDSPSSCVYWKTRDIPIDI